MSEEINKITEAFENTEIIKAAIMEGVAEALCKHKLAGQPVVVWRDGREVWIPASEIPDLSNHKRK